MPEQLFVYGTLRTPEVQREIIGREANLLADSAENFAAELSRIDDYEPEEHKRISVTTVSGKSVRVYVKT